MELICHPLDAVAGAAERRMNMWERSVEILNPVEALKKVGKDAKVLTNGDRIRDMSDEELADVVVCPHISNWELCIDDCKKCRLDWLKQPAEVNDG